MAIKRGYKQTDVGTIPEEWNVKPLQAVLTKSRLGGNYPNQDRETAYPLIKMGNIARGYIDISKTEYIAPGVTPERQHKLTEGDVLFNTRNTLDLVGKVAIWRNELPVAYYNSNLLRLEFDTQQVCSNEYANAAFNTAGAVAVLRGLATGTTSVAAIYTRDLIGMPFVIPPLPEQRAIAAALSEVNSLIGSLERLIAKKRDLKQAAMQQLLTGQIRLPEFKARTNASFKKTAHGLLPNDWDLKPLKELVDASRSIRYGIVQPGKFDPSGRYMIRGQDYSTGWVSPSELFRVSQVVEERYKNARVATGDLIITIVGAGTGHVEEIPSWLNQANLTQTTARIAIDRRKAVSGFVKHLLRTPIGIAQVGNFIKGAAQPGLNCGDVEKFVIPLPPTLHEQETIATVLTDMDVELATLQQRLSKTYDLKQGMMQELLTGRTRLL